MLTVMIMIIITSITIIIVSITIIITPITIIITSITIMGRLPLCHRRCLPWVDQRVQVSGDICVNLHTFLSLSSYHHLHLRHSTFLSPNLWIQNGEEPPVHRKHFGDVSVWWDRTNLQIKKHDEDDDAPFKYDDDDDDSIWVGFDEIERSFQ